MSLPPRFSFLSLGLLATALLIGGALLYVVQATRSEINSLEVRANNDRVWHVSNLPFEESQVVRELSNYLSDPSPASARVAVRQLEIYWARLDVLLSALNRDLLAEDFPEILEYVRDQFTLLQAHQEIFETLTPERARAVLEVFKEQGDRYFSTSFAISRLGYDNYAHLVTRATAAYQTACFLLSAFVLCIIILTIVLFVEARRNGELTLLAESANEAKSRFLANVSHELRTPLNGIIGTISLLEEASFPETQRSLIATLRACSEALLSQVSAVLDFSKLEQDAVPLIKKIISPRALAEDCCQVIEGSARRKALACELLVVGELPEAVRTVPDRIRQVLLNLLGNAVKFTDSGWIRLSVQWEAGTSILQFTVEDSGCGVAAEELPRIFEAFHQVDTSSSRAHEGTGLGLAISKALAESMGGSISVESACGVGTTFQVRIPVQVVPADSILPQPETPAEPIRAPSAGSVLKGARVLVAEDNPINRKVVSMMLARHGVEAESAANGMEAIALFEQGGRFNLVLMDCQMPGLDGVTATQRLRKAGIGVPIIALTADVTESAREDCFAAGMDDFMVKPVDQELLIATVSRWLCPQPSEKIPIQKA